MKYIRSIDFAAIDRSGPGERFVQTILDQTSAQRPARSIASRRRAGGGSPAGLHTHHVDQIFYILKGKMKIEIEGEDCGVGPGTLVIFPAGVSHRNWNGSGEPTLHLAFSAPMPDRNLPFSTSLKP